jgi:hypothetical protein
MEATIECEQWPGENDNLAGIDRNEEANAVLKRFIRPRCNACVHHPELIASRGVVT